MATASYTTPGDMIRNSRQKHVQRTAVVLLTCERLGTAEIMRRTGLAKPSVWR